MNLVDANIILRYLLDDHPELSPRAVEIIENEEVLAPLEVLCEVVYVLQKVYQIPREKIQIQLASLIDEPVIAVEKTDVVKMALEMYVNTKIDIVDAFLYAYHAVEDSTIFTFDGKLNKLLQKGRVE